MTEHTARRAALVVAVVLLVTLSIGLIAWAATGSVTLSFQVVRGAPSSVHTLYSGPMPVVGEVCEVVASQAGNNTSVHEDNDLQLSTGGGVIFFNDVERAPNVSTPGSASIIPGDSGVVTLILGPDGVYSADLILEFTCSPIPTTTTSTTSSTTSTTVPVTTTSSPESTTSAPTTTVPTESTSTTTPPTTSTTLTSECVDEPGEVICELPYTGPDVDVMAPLAVGLLLAGLATLGYARRES